MFPLSSASPVARFITVASAAAFLNAAASNASAQGCPGRWLPPFSIADSTRGGVYAMTTAPGGDLIITGNFTAGHGIVRYRPATGVFSVISTGLPDVGYAVAALDNGQIIAGGVIDNQAPYLRRFNGTAWSTIAPPLTPFCMLTLNANEVIIGGAGVVRYNAANNTSTPLGNFNNFVFTLAAMPNGDLIAGGNFTIAGGVACNRVARYSFATSTWTPLSSGTDNTVSALAVLTTGDVVAGGTFTHAGGLVGNHLARFTPATGAWSAFGAGADGNVLTLFAQPGGGFVAGGSFATIGGIAASRIARCDAAGAWTALDGGIHGLVSGGVPTALQGLPDGDIMVGGDFLMAGPNAARGLARYTFSQTADFNHDGDVGTDADIEAFFSCLAGRCCTTCPVSADFDSDSDVGTDQDIEAFFRVLAGAAC